MLIQGGKSNDGNVTGLDLSTVRASNGTHLYAFDGNNNKTNYLVESIVRGGGIALGSGNFANPTPAFGQAPDHNATTNRNAAGAHDDIYTRNFKTIADLRAQTDAGGAVINLTSLSGNKVFWRGYYAESDGGGNWGIVKTGNSTSLVDDGGSVFVIVNDAVNGVWIEANLKGASVNVKKFGAKGDGLQDDKSFIQSANDYLVSNGKGTLHFPNGTYKYTDTLLVKSSGIHWRGAGKDATKLAFVNVAGGVGISGDADKELSLNTYSYCSFKKFSLISTSATTDPDIYFDFTSFSYSEFDIQIATKRSNAACYYAQGNNGSSPYYNKFNGYLFGGDGAGGTNYTQTGIRVRQGLLGTSYTGSNGANANVFGPFPRCAALAYIVDMSAGNGNMFKSISGESITSAYYKLNDNPLIESGTATSATQNSLVDTNAAWGGSLINAAIKITSGKGVGQIRTINSATATTITLIDAWGEIPDATSNYEIYAGKCVDNMITHNRTEGLASSNPDFIIAKPGVRGTKETLNVVGSIGNGLRIRDESGSMSNSWFSESKVVFTEKLENIGPNANIDVYVKNSVFGGVMLSQTYVLNWLAIASSTASLGDTVTARLDVGGTTAGNGDFTVTAKLENGSTISIGQIASDERIPKNPTSRRLFLNVQTGPNFSASADLQLTWCATLV